MQRSPTFMALVIALGCLLVTAPLIQAQERQGKGTEAFRGSALSDYEVLNQRHEVVGSIDDFVINSQGQIEYIILAPSSSWGGADRLYVIPWSSVSPQRDRGALYLQMSPERLKNAPSFARNNWPDMASADWNARVQRYYGQHMAQEQQGRQRMQRTQQGQRSMAAETRTWDTEPLLSTAVLFDFGEARLNRDARDRLNHLVEQLKDTDFETVHLTGHADKVGSDAANFDIARRRAARVAAYLAQQGVPSEKIRILSLGEEVAGPEEDPGRFTPARRVDVAVLASETASTARMQRSGMHEAGRQPASREGHRDASRLSATVLSVDRDSGTVTVTTEYGDSVELQANDALLGRLMEGDSVEVRLRKLESQQGQRSRSGQSGDMSGQQVQ